MVKQRGVPVRGRFGRKGRQLTGREAAVSPSAFHERITPHVAQYAGAGGSAIDGRTTRHPGYALSQRKRKLIEQAFGWLKTVGLFRKLRHRGGGLVDWLFSFGAAAYNLVRWRNLVAQRA